MSDAATNAPASLGAVAAGLQALEVEKALAVFAGREPSVLENSEAFLDTSAQVHFVSILSRNADCRFDHEIAAPELVARADLPDLWAAQARGTLLAVDGASFARALDCPSCGTRKAVLELRERDNADARTCRRCGGALLVSGFATSDHIAAADAAGGARSGPVLELDDDDLLSLCEAGGDRRFYLVGEGSIPRSSTLDRIVVIGVGNIGSHLVPLLARMPAVAEILLVDPDAYEAKNIVGQAIAPSQVGRAKVDVQAEVVRTIAPHVRVHTRRCTIEALPTGHLAHSVVLGCLDSRGARLVAHRKAWRMSAVYIDAAVDAGGRQVKLAVFRPSHTAPCLECSWDADDYAAVGRRYACNAAAHQAASHPSLSHRTKRTKSGVATEKSVATPTTIDYDADNHENKSIAPQRNTP